MKNVKRNWDLLTDEERKKYIDELIEFVHNERNEKIGIIYAEILLNHFLQNVGLELYNKGIEESIEYLKDRIEDICIDMATLLKK
jgi:uncharacterized protein (DUF2164 family)